MNDLIDDVRIDGNIEFEVQTFTTVAWMLRNYDAASAWYTNGPFKSIYENVAYGLRIQIGASNAVIDERVEWALKVRHRRGQRPTEDSALGLSGGRQPPGDRSGNGVKPSVLLLNGQPRPDPISTLKIEELIHQLKATAIAIVTHNMQQAAKGRLHRLPLLGRNG